MISYRRVAQERLQLELLPLERVVVEVRYARAFRLWDRAGAVALELQKRHPDLRNLIAQPNAASYRLDENIEASVELEQTRFIIHHPVKSALNDFFDLVGESMAAVFPLLGVEMLTRVGARFLFFKSFEQEQSAAQAIIDTGLLRVPLRSAPGREVERAESVEYAVTLHRRATAATYRLKSETRLVDVEPTPQFQHIVQRVHKELSGVSFDADYFTTVPASLGQIDMNEWAASAFRAIKREGDELLLGTVK